MHPLVSTQEVTRLHLTGAATRTKCSHNEIYQRNNNQCNDMVQFPVSASSSLVKFRNLPRGV